MPPLKVLEKAEFGGVDSRSNPINMPTRRFLRVRNWVPRPDGHLELRDGYLKVNAAGSSSGAPTVVHRTIYIGTANNVPNFVDIPPTTEGNTVVVMTLNASWASVAALAGVPALFYGVESAGGFFGGYGAQLYYFENVSGGSSRITWPDHIAPTNAVIYELTPCTMSAMSGGITQPGLTDTADPIVGTDPNCLYISEFIAQGVGHIALVSAPWIMDYEVDQLMSGQLDGSGAIAMTTGTGSKQPTWTETGGYGGGYVSICLKPTPITSGIGGTTEPIHSIYPFKTVLGTVSGATAAAVAATNTLPPTTSGTVTTRYYAKLVKETISGLVAMSDEFGPFEVNAESTFQITDIPQDTDAVAWRVYFGLGGMVIGGGEDQVIVASRDLVQSWGWTITVTAPGPPDRPPIPNGTNCILFWQGIVPKVLRLDTLEISLPSIRGAAIQSAHRWQYALGKSGFVYMHNGTDKKFFDSVTFRDIGLPVLTPAQVANITVKEGMAAISQSEANDVQMALAAGEGAYWNGYDSNYVYFSFFDTATNLLMNSIHPLGGGLAPRNQTQNQRLNITQLPTSAVASVVGLLAVKQAGAAGAQFAYQRYLANCSAQGTGTTLTITCPTPHGLQNGDVVVWGTGGVAITTIGPWGVTYLDAYRFSVQTENAQLYTTGVTSVYVLVKVPNGSTTASLNWEYHNISGQGYLYNNDGVLLLNYADSASSAGIPASAIGGAQPGYQFYASIYNRVGGQHIGNRVAIGPRLNNDSDCIVLIDGLPDYSTGTPAVSHMKWGGGQEGGNPRGGTSAPTSIPGDPEWSILIGRTGDGGEVPYAVVDANGNWISAAPGQGSLTISDTKIDGNAELPVMNDIPPAFIAFWREADRQCGAIPEQPFVYRSGSERDAQTGIFMGDPAQAWAPSKVETFPTAEAILAGFGYMQESWVFTANDCAQLTELTGEAVWNGPYNVGIASAHAFSKGWQSLPFWVSRDKQLCTMLPNSHGPIPISGEYEAAELARIGDDFLARTETVYFRDSARMIEAIRIKCTDEFGNPFTVIHDFNLRDANSPYGSGYDEMYQGALATDFTHEFIRDAKGHGRVWAGGADGNFYQLYAGGDDAGDDFTADLIGLFYLGGYNPEVKMLEWYGDQGVQWYITDVLDAVPDPTTWTNLSDQARPVPGQEHNSHYMADLQRPEMTHVYLWAQLTSHAADAADPTNPKAWSDPPHVPVEMYGRIYLVSPILGNPRGR